MIYKNIFREEYTTTKLGLSRIFKDNIDIENQSIKVKFYVNNSFRDKSSIIMSVNIKQLSNVIS